MIRREIAGPSEADWYRAVFEQAAPGILLIRATDRVILDANPAVCELFGRAHEQLVDSRVEAVVAPDAIPLLDNIPTALEQAGDWRETIPIILPDGTSIGSEWTVCGAPATDFLVVSVTGPSDAVPRDSDQCDREACYRGVVDSPMVGILFWHIDGRVVDANDKLLEMIGYPRSEIESGALRWTDLTPAEFSDADRRMLEELRSTGRCTPYEKEFIRKEGTRIPILIGTSFVPGRNDLGVAFIVDITRRKQAEAERDKLFALEREARAALQATQDRLNDVLETTTDAIISVDCNDRIVYMNYSAAELTRVDRSDVVGRPVWDVFPEARALKYYTEYQRAKRERINLTYEEFYPPLEIWTEVRVFPMRDGVVSYFRNITEQKQGAKEKQALLDALERERTWLKAILDQMPSGLAIAEAPSGKLVLYNEEAVRLLRHTLRLKRDCGRYPRYGALHSDGTPFHPEEYPLSRAAFQGEAIHQEEILYQRGDCTLCYFSVNAAPIFDAQGNIVAAVSTFHDISAQKEGQAQLKRLNETLEQRIAERTALAEKRARQLQGLTMQLTRAEQQERRRLAQILHDHVQQLLVATKMRLAILRRDLAQRNHPAVAAVECLLDDSIQATRSLAVELAPPVLHERGLGQAIEWLSGQVEAQHGLHVDVTADADADSDSEEVRELLFQAIRELLLNVVKHADTDRAWIRIARRDRQLQIELVDKGKGFDPSTLPDTGSSFGLFYVREHLEFLGGYFHITSTPGQGTHVTISVPIDLHEEAAEGEPEVAAVPEAVPRGDRTSPEEKLRILLVDDHQIVREGLAGLLRREPDLEIVGEASDGETALDLTRTLEPDVIIMDVNMPRMNGVEATRRIMAEMPHVRILALSLHNEDDMAKIMLEAGAETYLTKGGPSENLIRAIRTPQVQNA